MEPSIETNTKRPNLYTLTNINGVEITFTDFGARLQSICVPDKNGDFADILLSYSSIDSHMIYDPYFGAICGRVANRIGMSKFSLVGKEFQLQCNHGRHHLHGGEAGFHTKFWQVSEKIETKHYQSYTLSLHSPDGDQGYPGNLTVEVTYKLTDSNELIIEYAGETDAPTVVNLTSHGYFNLKGEGNGTILEHRLKLNANRYTPVDAELIPTGELKPVESTCFDFRSEKPISEQITLAGSVFATMNGIDHNWVLNRESNDLILAATLTEGSTGRMLEVFTTQPGLQIYTGNHFNGELTGKCGKPHIMHSGIALEAQAFPDSPNHPNFPSIVLNPGDKYLQQTIYRFGLI